MSDDDRLPDNGDDSSVSTPISVHSSSTDALELEVENIIEPFEESSPSSNSQKQSSVLSSAQVIDLLGLGSFQLILAIVASFTFSLDSLITVSLSEIAPLLAEDLNLGTKVGAIYIAISFVGMMIGSMLWGILADKWGRKMGFFITPALILVFSLLSVVMFLKGVVGFLILCFFQFFVGMGMGAAPICYSLFSEFIPTRNRGKVLLAFQISWSIGSISASTLGVIILPYSSWRVYYTVCVIPCFFLIFINCFIPESARWLATGSQKQVSSAKRTFLRMARLNRKSEELGMDFELTNNDNASSASSASSSSSSFVALEEHSLTTTFSKSSVTGIVYSKYLKSTILIWILWFVTPFVFYGLTFVTPLLYEEIFGKHSTGMYFGVVLATIGEIPALASGILFIDLIGRKLLLIIGFLSFSFFSSLVALYSYDITPYILLPLLMCCRGSILVVFDSIYVYTPEVYPTDIRGKALGIASSISRVAGIVSPFVPYLFHGSEKNGWISLVVFGFGGIIASMCALMLPLETKGKDIDSVL